MDAKKAFQNLVLFFCIFAAASGAWAGEPTESVKKTTDRILAIVSDPALKDPAREPERKKMIWEAVDERFDWHEMGKRALARHWKKRTEEEKGETLCKNIIAFIGVIVARGKAENAMASFTEEPNVKRIYGTTGMFNALMEIYAENLGDLRTTINHMRTSRMVQATETFLVIDIAEMEEFSYEATGRTPTSRRAIGMIKPSTWR